MSEVLAGAYGQWDRVMSRNSFSTHFKKRNLVFKFCLTVILLQNHKWFHYGSQLHGSQMFRPPSASWSCHVSGDCDGTVVLWAPSYHIGLRRRFSQEACCTLQPTPPPHPPSPHLLPKATMKRLCASGLCPLPLAPSTPPLFPSQSSFL